MYIYTLLNYRFQNESFNLNQLVKLNIKSIQKTLHLNTARYK